jgi:serine/threonine protein kinase
VEANSLSTYLQPGTILRERYTIAGLIGAGGMGAVYLADDDRLTGRQCAIKETLPHPTLNEAATQATRRQFHQEASILARLDHPGLPKVSDYFTEGERDYLVMDFVPGQNLLEIVTDADRNGHFLDEATALNWVDQLCDTLSYLHSRQPVVLHRDVKPANIKLTPDNRVKLVDFGLVKPLDPDDPSTLTGLQGAGSLPYAPLEQYVDHLGHTDARTDLYALGATVYHLLTGRIPVSAQERFLLPESLAQPDEINPQISPGVAQAILMAMAPHPKDRPPSVVHWQQILHSGAVTALMADQSSPGNRLRQSIVDNLALMALTATLLAVSLWITFG